MNEKPVAEATALIVTAFIQGRAPMSNSDLVDLIRQVSGALAGDNLSIRSTYEIAPPQLAASEKASPIIPTFRWPSDLVKKDHVICAACGFQATMLKRHLLTAHSLTPDEYKRKFGLPHDHTLTAPEYSKVRSALAKSSGLGTKKASRWGR